MKKREIEVIMKIIIFFLSTLLLLSVLNGGMAPVTIMGALAFTYLFVHYWEKRYLKSKK